MTAPTDANITTTTGSMPVVTGVTTGTIANGVPLSIPGVAPQAPAAAPAAPAAAPADQGAPDAAQTAAQGEGLPDDPDALKAEIAKLRRENGSARTTAKANAAKEAREALAAEIGKVLGLTEDEQVDPAKLTAQLGEQRTAVAQAQRELSVYRLATAAGADPSALLDSVSFMRSVASIDPTDATAVADAIKAAVAANPTLATAPVRRAPGPNPALGASGNGAPDLEAQIAEAQKRGDVMSVIRLQNQKLAAARQ